MNLKIGPILRAIFFANLFLFGAIFPRSFVYSNQPTISQRSGLSKVEANFLRKGGITHDHITFVLIDLKTGNVLDEHNSHLNFPLASVSKILSSHYALSILGPKDRPQTRLMTNGSVKDGVLTGDLWIVGGGDPLLNSSDLFSMAKSLEKGGIKKISGSYYFDDSFLFNKSEIAIIGPGDESYNPGLNSLSVNFNRFEAIRSGRYKRPKEWTFSTIPNLEVLEVVKTKEDFRPGKRFTLDLTKKGKEVWMASTKNRYQYREVLPVRNPSLITAALFKSYAAQLGITLPSPTPKLLSSSTNELAQHTGNTALKTVKLAMEYSNNLLAETLLLRSSKKLLSKNVTLKKAADNMLAWYRKNYPGEHWKGADFHNGSGLTPRNQLTAMAMAKTLQLLGDVKYGNKWFHTLLSLSGLEGWLASRLNDVNTAHRVWAKTGSLDYVNNIAGYFHTDSGRWISFAIFVQNKVIRDKIDKTNSMAIERLRKRAPRWKERTGRSIDGLLKHWMSKW